MIYKLYKPFNQSRIHSPCVLHNYKLGNDSIIKCQLNVTKSRCIKFNRPKDIKKIAIPSPSPLPAPIINKSYAKQSNYQLDIIKNLNSIHGIGSNKLLAIFAPGPSILEADIGKLISVDYVDTMTINKPDDRYWETKYWIFCDYTQYSRNKTAFNNFNNTVITPTSFKINHKNSIKFKLLHDKGFSFNLVNGVYVGWSTTYVAMQFALWMNYDKIFIFGCDMGRVNGKLHSYGVNPDVPEDVRMQRFAREANNYMIAANIMDENIRNRFYFCSSYNKWEFVDKFNRLDQRVAIDYIISCANALSDKNIK